MAEPIVLLDERRRMVFVNQHVVHRFGFACAELVGHPLSKLIGAKPPDDSDPPAPPHQDQGGPIGVATSIECAGGTRRPVVLQVTRFGAGNAQYSLCLFRDADASPEGRHGGRVEEHLKEAQRTARIGSWSWDITTDEHWWSDEMYRMLQIDPSTHDRPFERFMGLIHPEDRQRMAERMQRIVLGAAPSLLELRVTLPDGTPRTFHSQGVATLDASGRPTRLHGTLQDVTEQVATQVALRLTDLRYREAQRLAKIGNWEWDLATNTSWWSDELYRLLEEKPQDFPSTFENFLTKVHPDDRGPLVKGQSTISTGPNAYTPTQIRLTLSEGREKIIEQIVQVRVDAQGKPLAVVGTVHDITERRALEDKLRDSEARYASTVELVAVGIAHIDLNGRVTWSNGRLREMLGYDNDELLALTIRDITHPEDATTADRDHQRLHAGDVETLTVEKRCLRKDGTVIWVRITTATRRADDNEPLYDVAILEDITTRKSAEARVTYLATHDELTGLPNRTLFAELLEHAIETAKRYKRRCALLFIDLDRFKIVNDSLGHEAGDLLLQEVACRLRQCMQSRRWLDASPATSSSCF